MKILAAGALIVLVAATAAGAETLQPYRHPSGAFTIFYPKGWQVVQRGGTTAFTPGDGLTFFSILPAIELAGRVDAEALFQMLVVEEFGRLPGFKVLSRQARPLSAPGGSSVEATWVWTHPESKTPKRAWTLISAQSSPGGQGTAAGFVMYEAPARDWRRLEPVFKQMLQSLKFPRS